MPRLIRRAAREEHGFTMLAAMAAMLVVLSLSAAAFAAANGDIRLSRYSGEQKSAYAAAEAGVAYYLYHLSKDPNYWSMCTDVPAPSGQPAAPVNQPWDGTGADPRQWRKLADSGAEYTVELLPAAGATCDRNDPEGTMLDPTSGSFRIRATGRSSATGQVKRSVIATFKARTFLDFLYFTEIEAQDPVVWTKISQLRRHARHRAHAGLLPDSRRRQRRRHARPRPRGVGRPAVREVLAPARPPRQRRVPRPDRDQRGVARLPGQVHRDHLRRQRAHRRPAAHQRRHQHLRQPGVRAQRRRPHRGLRGRGRQPRRAALPRAPGVLREPRLPGHLDPRGARSSSPRRRTPSSRRRPPTCSAAGRRSSSARTGR